MSVSRNRQMKMIEKRAMKTVKKPPAIPSTDEIAWGIFAATCCAPSCTLSAAPESPNQPDSSSESLSCCTVVGSCWRKSRTLPTSGTRKRMNTTVTMSALPMTVTVAARPRDRFVFAITKRTGYSNTSARKIPTNTTRKVLPIATNAATTANAATTSRIVRIGRKSSTRFFGASSMRRV
jgi:hypothetical protein